MSASQSHPCGDGERAAAPEAEPSAACGFEPGPVVWVPRPVETELYAARWNVRWLIKIAKDERFTPQERVGIIANFPTDGIEPVHASAPSSEFAAIAKKLQSCGEEARGKSVGRGGAKDMLEALYQLGLAHAYEASAEWLSKAVGVADADTSDGQVSPGMDSK